jgi:hypothetical protein
MLHFIAWLNFAAFDEQASVPGNIASTLQQ